MDNRQHYQKCENKEHSNDNNSSSLPEPIIVGNQESSASTLDSTNIGQRIDCTASSFQFMHDGNTNGILPDFNCPIAYNDNSECVRLR